MLLGVKIVWAFALTYLAIKSFGIVKAWISYGIDKLKPKQKQKYPWE